MKWQVDETAKRHESYVCWLLRIFQNFAIDFNDLAYPNSLLKQGNLTEGEGSVRLTSLY
jgi:hypothetical protein